MVPFLMMSINFETTCSPLEALPVDIWLTALLPFLEPPELLSVSLLNHHFHRLVLSHRQWKQFATMFPAQARSIRVPWHEVAWIHNASLTPPVKSAKRIGQVPLSSDDIGTSQEVALSREFFRGDGSVRVLASVTSRLRAYHRTLWRSRRFGNGLCRILHTSWDAPFDSFEYRIFHFPAGMIAPAAFHTWGDYVMWREDAHHPLSVVTVEGLTLFTKESSFKERAVRRLKKLLRPKRYKDWYTVRDSEADWEEDPPTPPPVLEIEEMCLTEKLRLYNVFDGTEYTVPLRRLYKATIRLGEACALYFHDIVEHTLCNPFLFIFQIHNPDTETIHFMSWNVTTATPNWIINACDAFFEVYPWDLPHFKFGNALFGYLADPVGQYFRYNLHDIATGDLVQRIYLDDFPDPLSNVEFACNFTSFFFIAWSPRVIADQHRKHPLKLTAPFSIYRISTGEKLYTLHCPLCIEIPDGTFRTFLPTFQRTDESERYWIFAAPRLHVAPEDANTVLVWDVVEQRWHVLMNSAARQDDMIIYFDGEGKLRMKRLELSPPESISEEEAVWIRYRWNRVPTAREARKLKRITA